MALFKYFSRDVSSKPRPFLTEVDKKTVDEFVKEEEVKKVRKVSQHNEYTPEERAAIAKYTAENGPARASRHLLGKRVPESTARKLRDEYLTQLKLQIDNSDTDHATVSVLPIKKQGRPLLIGERLDRTVQDFIRETRKSGGVINLSVVIAMALGIVTAKDPSSLRENGGHLVITPSWAKSLLRRMGYVKRRCSNAGKVTLVHFEELKEEYLADMKAEVLMFDIPIDLVFNWDQTGIHLIPTGDRTMHQAKEKIIPISHSDDKRQITGVFAVTAKGEYFPPQLLYQGKTERCHPKFTFPNSWDIWHSETHWSTEVTMLRYIERVIVPFLNEKRTQMKLPMDYPALAIFDCFRGQTTPSVKAILTKYHIRYVVVPPNCTDKLQPLDIAINKPFKSGIKKNFQLWYAEEVKKQLNDSPSEPVKVDVSAAAVKHRSASWINSTWNDICYHPEFGENGFRKAGILDAISSISQ